MKRWHLGVWLTGLVLTGLLIEFGVGLMVVGLWREGTLVGRVFAGALGACWVWFAVAILTIILEEKR